MTGTFPRFGSNIFAIPRPIAFEIACPPTVIAALTNCRLKPRIRPIAISCNIYKNPTLVSGSIEMPSKKLKYRKVNTADIAILNLILIDSME